MSKNYYEILGLDSTATAKEIKKAYQKLARKYHPDKWVGKQTGEINSAEFKFNEVEEAYRILKDPINRAHYDKTGDGKTPKTAEMASQKLITLFAKNIKAVLEKEMAMESMSSRSFGSYMSGVTSGMERILETVRHELKSEKQNLTSIISGLEKGVAKLNKYKRKIRSKGDTNLYLQVIDQQIIATSGALAQAGFEEAACTLALTSLDDYEYIIDDEILSIEADDDDEPFVCEECCKVSEKPFNNGDGINRCEDCAVKKYQHV